MGRISRTSSTAWASFYLGLISFLIALPAIVTRFYPLLVLIALTAVSAIVLKVRDKRQISARGELRVGSRLATGGVVLSITGVILGFILLLREASNCGCFPRADLLD